MTDGDDETRRAEVVGVALAPDEEERVQRWGNLIGLELFKGNLLTAMRLVNEAAADMHGCQWDEPIVATSLVDAGVMERTVNMLEASHNVLTVGELLRTADEPLLETSGVQETTVRRLWRSVATYAVRRCTEVERQLVQLRVEHKLRQKH